MNRSRAETSRTQRCGNYNNVVEPEYDVVDDHEGVHRVHIFPARPINDEREYADRDLPRSSSAQSLSSLATVNSDILPRRPLRETSHTTGPAINRNSKPGRQRTKLDKKLPPVPHQHSHRSPPSPSALTMELVNHWAGMTLNKPCRREPQRTAKQAQFNSYAKGPNSPESVSAPDTLQRRSWDLESFNMERRSHQSLERVPSKRHHHEWPQTKEDFDQHDFVPMEKPQQTYCEEDWYVGACNRADAEHALHLVNKDGAFLVRDCSINTDSEPLVLVVYYDKKVYNVKIRFIECINKYALGTGQRSNDMFDSVADIVKFHSIFPIILVSGRNMPGNKYPENCVLTFPVTKRDVDQLLR
ncbi:cytokine-dependent hematopoietic cell linker isoform X2 [Stegastes partitus]|uniref:Cytokine-dependent hematopoietic cell linker isoform X2 n=1 Tax=Stegastes partitus TaxID=144197 RepID=A0A9Y4NBK0_9TELE|nr:PREDICTED: cytokine-dependent hematopoietic cell linker isoform X2 [Stegastes partitus]